jgi:hypothetical protein
LILKSTDIMKKFKLLASATLVLAIVGSALAFRPMQFAKVYCQKSELGVCQSKINYDLTTSTSQITDPCDNGNGGEFVIINNVCTEQFDKKYVQVAE